METITWDLEMTVTMLKVCEIFDIAVSEFFFEKGRWLGHVRLLVAATLTFPQYGVANWVELCTVCTKFNKRGRGFESSAIYCCISTTGNTWLIT